MIATLLDLMDSIVIRKMVLVFAINITMETNVTNVKKDMKNFPIVTNVLIHFMGTLIANHVHAMNMDAKIKLVIKLQEFANVLKILLGINVILVQSIIMLFLRVMVRLQILKTTDDTFKICL